MSSKWDDKSWQKDFLNMKSHSPSDAKLLMGVVKGLKGAWRLGVRILSTKDLRKYRRGSNSNDRKNKLAERTIRKWKI